MRGTVTWIGSVKFLYYKKAFFKCQFIIEMLFFWDHVFLSSNIFPLFSNSLTSSLTKWCCYITVDSTTTALQNCACTYRCISKQMHYKTLLSPNGYMSGNLWKLEHSVLSGKKKLFYNIILTQNHTWHITQSDWNNYSV